MIHTGIDKRDEYTMSKAVDIWGKTPQVLMAIEECAELTVALTKWLNRGGEDAPVIEEVADVLIMATQMAVMFGIDDVQRVFRQKMDRLEARLLDMEARICGRGDKDFLENGAALCPKCGENFADEPHTCPWLTELHGDHDSCSCCDACTSACNQEV